MEQRTREEEIQHIIRCGQLDKKRRMTRYYQRIVQRSQLKREKGVSFHVVWSRSGQSHPETLMYHSLYIDPSGQ